jgi:hypothetical protein
MVPRVKVHHLGVEDREVLLGAIGGVLAADPRVAFACAHGSVLDDIGFRDVDVGVEFDGVPDERLTAAAVDLSVRLSDTARVPVDVRALNGAPVGFRYNALRGRVLACRDDLRYADALEHAMRREFDLAPFRAGAFREAMAP